MLKHELEQLIANGENSGIEFQRDDMRPEQLARDIAAFANLNGGRLLLGVEDNGSVSGITRSDLETWILETVFGRIHPMIIPFYEEVQWDGTKRVAIVTVAPGFEKPFVVRHNDQEYFYLRLGSQSCFASLKQKATILGQIKRQMPERDALISRQSLGNGASIASISALQRQIVEFIEANPGISYEELAKFTQRDISTIRRNIQQLKGMNIIAREGSRKTGKWRITHGDADH